MRLSRRSTEARGVAGPGRRPGSPYRTADEAWAQEDGGEGTRAGAELWALVFVLGCSLLRFAIFVRSERRFGLDPALALALALGSAYTLYALSGDSKR
jgi:hypothetical protein